MSTLNKKQMPSVYDPSLVESSTYALWEEKKYFHANPKSEKKPFTIVMPPPNITGQLHMGHALDLTNQDILIRFKKLIGFETLWVPGTDHASIATEVKIVEKMASEGVSKSDLGRDGFLERAWDWKAQYGGKITKQLKKMGAACDWERERFTLDEGCSQAVKFAFVDLYKRGLIYQGNRIINWCPECKTALSDAEVEFVEQNSSLWHIKYSSQDGKNSVIVATTRPETMFGDVAVAVNPNDPRYTHLVGTNLVLPLVNKLIPVIADDYVDIEFGTGALKITPAHDPNDFEVGKRHNLEVVKIMNDNGTINELGGVYEGLDRFEARKRVENDLKALGVLTQIQQHTHNVGSCYRCNTTIEPIISKQWFVSMKPLAKEAIDVVRNNDVEFVPPRFSKTYFNWMENIRDWCISRQLWWGHRIPAYYCQDCGEIIVSLETPNSCDKCGCKKIVQDEDVLDTWFSSGMWPFSTLGWPENTAELEKFYPTSVLVTSYDIIFFWVARMVVFGMSQMKQIPFSTVLIHGLVRDSQGRKMSKSLGNGIDPLEIIEKYGADSLRLSLIMGNAPGNDMRFYDEKVEACRNFANKIWNASRFVSMNIETLTLPLKTNLSEINLDITDKWIISRLDKVSAEVSNNLNEYDLGLAAQKVYDFAWSEFCDWYIEMAKPRLFSENENEKADVVSVLVHVLKAITIMLNPFMPFITEQIYTHLPNSEESIFLCQWPKNSEQDFEIFESATTGIMELIKEIRNIRVQMNVPPSKKTNLLIVANAQNAPWFLQSEIYLKKLGFATKIEIVENKANIQTAKMVSVVSNMAEIFIPMDELVDIKSEILRMEKEKENWQSEIARAKGKLANQGFVAKAPEKVILEVQTNLAKYENLLQKVVERILELQKI